jgi:hypothetical protein
MSSIARILFALCLSGAAGGCATTQPEPGPQPNKADTERLEADQRRAAAERYLEQRGSVRRRFDDQARLLRVYHRLAMANVELCDTDIGPRIGAYVRSEADFSHGYRDAARAELGIDQDLTVIAVADGSPAHEAGLREGDHLVSFNGQTIEPGTRGQEFERDVQKTLLADAPYEVRYTRGDAENTTLLTPRTGCRYRARIAPGAFPDAYADGRSVYLTTGMMRLTQTDDELAVIVAHGMAHNAESHAARRQRYSMGGMVLDIAAMMLLGINTGGGLAEATANALSDDFETEADYLGTYMMARAGFDYESALAFWQKLALALADSDVAIERYSHPFQPDRLRVFDKASREIRKKQESNIELMPEPKPAPPVPLSIAERAAERDPFGQ